MRSRSRSALSISLIIASSLCRTAELTLAPPPHIPKPLSSTSLLVFAVSSSKLETIGSL